MKKKLIILFLAVFCINNRVFAEDINLNDKEKEFLINLSRQTLYWFLKDGTVPSVHKQDLTENIESKKACFVTLYKKNVGLRGCVGSFFLKKSLYQNIIDSTIAAATKDKRFDPVAYDELKDIKLEISVLTDPKKITFNSPQELLNKVQPYKDGVIMTTKYGSSTYLPQVWKQLPDKNDFMSSLCRKHGAPSDYWKTNFKDISIQIYQAVVFDELIYGRIIVGQNGAVVGDKGAYLLGSVQPLAEGLSYGGYKVGKGTKLMPGTILSPDSDIIEN